MCEERPEPPSRKPRRRPEEGRSEGKKGKKEKRRRRSRQQSRSPARPPRRSRRRRRHEPRIVSVVRRRGSSVRERREGKGLLLPQFPSAKPGRRPSCPAGLVDGRTTSPIGPARGWGGLLKGRTTRPISRFPPSAGRVEGLLRGWGRLSHHPQPREGGFEAPSSTAGGVSLPPQKLGGLLNGGIVTHVPRQAGRGFFLTSCWENEVMDPSSTAEPIPPPFQGIFTLCWENGVMDPSSTAAPIPFPLQGVFTSCWENGVVDPSSTAEPVPSPPPETSLLGEGSRSPIIHSRTLVSVGVGWPQYLS